MERPRHLLAVIGSQLVFRAKPAFRAKLSADLFELTAKRRYYINHSHGRFLPCGLLMLANHTQFTTRGGICHHQLEFAGNGACTL
jgi:hypothetical protein